MRMRNRRSESHPDEAPDYWITYSDLLVSLLVVFALLLFLTLSKMQKNVADVEKTMAANERALAIAAQSMHGLDGKLKFDPKTQTLTMDEEVLFAYGSAELRPEAQQTVAAIATEFVPKLIADTAIDHQLQEIVVEGHTDTVGTYMSNLDLSQKRAMSVMRALVEGTDGMSYAERLRTLITASGKSETEPKHDASGEIDAALSRRIEIHIRFRNDDLLKRLVGTKVALK